MKQHFRAKAAVNTWESNESPSWPRPAETARISQENEISSVGTTVVDKGSLRQLAEGI